MVLALAGLGVIAWRVIESNDDDKPSKEGSESAQPLTTRYVDDRLGITVRIPDGWTTPSKGSIARFATPDESMSVAVISTRTAPLNVLQKGAEVDLTKRFQRDPGHREVRTDPRARRCDERRAALLPLRGPEREPTARRTPARGEGDARGRPLHRLIQTI
jgi:hypothetical protein